MKTKWTKRLLSGFLSLMMLVCLIPTSALAVENGEPITIEYHTQIPHYSGPIDIIDRSFLETCGVKNEQTTIMPGEDLTINLPTVINHADSDPELTYGNHSVYHLFTDYREPYIEILYRNLDTAQEEKQVVAFDGVKYYGSAAEDTKNATLVSVGTKQHTSQVPSWATSVAVNYMWNADDKSISESELKESFVTNIIYDLKRTIEQNGKPLDSVENNEGTDVYNVTNINDLTLSYDASMDMTLLDGFFGMSSWENLQNNKNNIANSTRIDLHFNFDEQITLTEDTLIMDDADLVSDMFTEVKDENGKWWTIDGNELILHCRWWGENAKVVDKLDPMIYLNNVRIKLAPTNWDEQSIQINNSGLVDGYAIISWNNGTSFGAGGIDGGKETDTFILKKNEKISEPGMNKTIVTGYEEDGTPIEVDADTAAAGENVTFRLNSNIPEDWGDVIDYTYTDKGTVGHAKEGGYTLVFHDVMDSNFTPTGYYFVYLGNSVQPIADKYYTVNSDPGDDCTFEVSVDLAAMYNDGVIKEADFGVTTISVSYNATLNENTVAGDYHNTAHVSYPGGYSEPDDVVVDTYQIEIFKHDQTTHAPLANAEFQLYQKDAEGNVIEESRVTLISGSDGIAITKGLDAGTYYLKETKAPDDYVCSDAEVTIVIPDQIDESTNIAHIEFANSQIPHTGGMGTTLFSIVGGVLIAMAGTIFVISRRKRRA